MLQNGDHDQAIRSFRRNLVEIRQCVTESASHEETQDIDTEHSGADASTLILSVALGDCKSNNLLDFYNHAFVVGFPPTTYTRTSQQGIDQHHTRLATALLFNIALTFHRKGLLDEPILLVNLRRALQVYQRCLDMSLLSHPVGGLDDLYVIQLVAWNNMGHVHSHLAKKDDAIRCRSLLYQALFEDAALSLALMHGYPYASFYLFAVGSEVRRRGFRVLSPEK